MEGTQIPIMAFVVFGFAFACGLGLFASLYLITRKLGLAWVRSGANFHLENGAAWRLGKLVWGAGEAADKEKVGGLLWAIRLLWLALTGLIITFAVMIAGAA